MPRPRLVQGGDCPLGDCKGGVSAARTCWRRGVEQLESQGVWEFEGRKLVSRFRGFQADWYGYGYGCRRGRGRGW
jgi:hypothetical protein